MRNKGPAQGPGAGGQGNVRASGAVSCKGNRPKGPFLSPAPGPAADRL